MKKEWKQIANFPHYLISSDGEVWTTRKNKLVAKQKTNYGHLSVDLSENGITKRFYVHRLVAQTFIPNPNNLPIVNHKDENPTNNCVDNLEWCTKSYNNTYGTRIERIRKKISGVNNYFFGKHHTEEVKKIMREKKYKKVILNDKIEFCSLQECAKYLNVSPGLISKILTGRRKQLIGNTIKYKK